MWTSRENEWILTRPNGLDLKNYDELRICTVLANHPRPVLIAKWFAGVGCHVGTMLVTPTREDMVSISYNPLPSKRWATYTHLRHGCPMAVMNNPKSLKPWWSNAAGQWAALRISRLGRLSPWPPDSEPGKAPPGSYPAQQRNVGGPN